MARVEAHRLPARDPIAGGPLVITEVEAVESGVTIRGRFEVPRFAQLSPDQARFLETFLRCRGMLNSVERELGISYPTARGRLDGVLKALDLHAVREEAPGAPPPPEPTEASPEEAFEFVPTPEAEPVADEATPSAWEDVAEEFKAPFEAADETAVEESPAEFEATPAPEVPRRSRDELLSLLEKGEISVEELKKELSGSK